MSKRTIFANTAIAVLATILLFLALRQQMDTRIRNGVVSTPEPTVGGAGLSYSLAQQMSAAAQARLAFASAASATINMHVTFSEGKYGLSDSSEKVIVPPQYDNIFPFSEGLAAVEVGGKWGFIDMAGKLVIPTQYSYVNSFSEGLAAVLPDNELSEWVYIDTAGKLVIQTHYSSVHSFSQGLAFVADISGYSIKVGYIDTTGKLVIPIQYFKASDFSDGLAAVCVGKDATTCKWGYIDMKGELAIAPQYDAAADFSDGQAVVVVNGKSVVIDPTGKDVSGS